MSAATTRPPCVYVCVCSTALIGPVSRLLCDQWMGFHWQSITSPTPTRRRHHHLLCRHTQTPPMAAQKGCQQKWKMVYSEHRPADTTCMKGPGIVHGPIHQGRYKKEDYAVVWKMEGEIESKRRGNIVTQTQRLCVSGQTLIWFPFFSRLAVPILPSTTHTQKKPTEQASEWLNSYPGSWFSSISQKWHFTNREETMAIKGKKQSSRQQ